MKLTGTLQLIKICQLISIMVDIGDTCTEIGVRQISMSILFAMNGMKFLAGNGCADNR